MPTGPTENAARRIKGVRGTAEEIEVRFLSVKITADDRIARRTLDVIEWASAIPSNAAQIMAGIGVVALTGTIDWLCQKDDVDAAARKRSGVLAVTNEVTIKQKTTSR